MHASEAASDSGSDDFLGHYMSAQEAPPCAVVSRASGSSGSHPVAVAPFGDAVIVLSDDDDEADEAACANSFIEVYGFRNGRDKSKPQQQALINLMNMRKAQQRRS